MRGQKLLLDYSYASGQRFRDFVEVLAWPQTEAIRCLRNRCTTISVSQQDVAELTTRWEGVYSSR